jgi:RNA polymerase sigma-70 factor (ECF subfamily)
MSEENETRLSRIKTLWSLVRDAHGNEDEKARQAQADLLQRYGGAIQRYLMAALRDRDGVDEVYQEFAVQFIRGKLRGADPTRGQFRRYLKSVLFHLVADYRTRKGRSPRQLDPEAPEPGVYDPESAEDEAFLRSWREDLLERTWTRLQEHEQQTGQPFHTALRMRALSPELRSEELARRLAETLNRVITAENARQIVRRARTRFAELLLSEVRESLDAPEQNALLEELAEIGLLEYVRPALNEDKDSPP